MRKKGTNWQKNRAGREREREIGGRRHGTCKNTGRCKEYIPIYNINAHVCHVPSLMYKAWGQENK